MRKDDFQVEEFPGLTLFQAEEKSRPLRVCIATEEIYGPVRNGGIASTYYHLARILAAEGHDVTICYLKGMTKCENKTIDHWISFYNEKNIRFIPLPMEEGELNCASPFWQRRCYSFYRWLTRQKEYDVVHTSEWRGGAFYALMARQQGLAFRNTLFLVKSSSPWIWNRHYMMLPVDNFNQVVCMYLERKTLEMADIVIGGSAHLLSFMRRKGYTLPPDRTMVQPNIIDLQDLGIKDKRPATPYGERLKSRDVVFFGRLEGRKGLDIFCEAINRLVDKGVSFDKVTFMGKQGRNLATYPKLSPLEYIQQETAKWPFPVEILMDYQQDQAIGYLCEKPRIGVMPSVIENSTMTVYECLVHKVPFIATKVGGTPELIAEEHRDPTLVDPHPESLANRLEEVLEQGAVVAKGAFECDENVDQRLKFHRYLAGAMASKDADTVRAELQAGIGKANEELRAAGKQAPLDKVVDVSDLPKEPKVSLCLYHHQRPAFLEKMVDAILAQTEEPDQVLILNDGEPFGQAAELMDQYKERFAAMPGWKILTTPHRCVGSSYNAMAREASGDLLVFLNVENGYIKPDFVASMKKLAARATADAFSFVSDRFDFKCEPDAETKVTRSVPMGGDLASAFFKPDALGGPAFAVRKASFESSGGCREQYHVSNIEKEYLVRLVTKGYTVQVVPECLIYDRQIESNVPRNEQSGEFLVGMPMMEDAPYYLETIMLYTRFLAQK